METIEPYYWIEKFRIPANDILGLSDYIRFDYLSNYPCTLYLDTDVYCVSAIPDISGIGYKSIQAIWNGEDTEGIKRIFEKGKGKQILWDLRREMSGINLSEYFEHKPIWRKQLISLNRKDSQ